MFSRRRDFLILRLAVADLLVIAVSFGLAYVLRQQLPAFRLFYLNSGPMAALLALSMGAWLLVGSATGFYRSTGGEALRRSGAQVLRQSLLSAAALACFVYLLKLGEVSRLFMLLLVGINLLMMLAWRATAPTILRMVEGGDVPKRHYVIVGDGEAAQAVARHIEADETQFGRVLAFLHEDAGNAGSSSRADALPLSSLQRILRDHVVDEVIFTVGQERMPDCEQLLQICQEEGVKLRVLVSIFGGAAVKVTLDQLCNLPLLTFTTAPDNEYLLFVKRILDVAGACFMALVFLPPALIVMALIKLTSPGSVFFVQERCGLNGRRFNLFKFRSMYEDAPARRAMVESLNQLDGPVFKCANDPRITPLGRYLRRFSVDEWPQLINVIKGDMSLVGPRPPLPDEVDQYKPWQRRRLRMRPGLTCLWVIEGHNRLDFLNWMRLDLHYIDHWTLTLDCRILLQSIPHVLSGKGM